MRVSLALLGGTAPGPLIRDLKLISRVIRVIVGRDTQN